MITDFDAAELIRRLGNVVRLGTIAEVDTTYAFATVKIGNLLTRPLPWITLAAGTDRTWHAPAVGEQVVVLSPNGELASGVILCGGIYTTAKPAPSTTEAEWLILFRDGAAIRYNTATHALAVTGFTDVTIEGSGAANITIGGDATVTIGGKADIEVTGDTNLTTPTLALDGDMTCTGTITATTDVIGGGISLKGHKHGGVQSGGSQTSIPV